MKYFLTVIFTLLTVVQSLNTATIKKRQQFQDGLHFPIKELNGYPILTFKTTFAFPAGAQVPTRLNMLLCSFFPLSTYFNEHGGNEAHQLRVGLRMVPHNANIGLDITGRLLPSKLPSIFASMNIFGMFSIKRTSVANDPFNDLMQKVPNKVISIWYSRVEQVASEGETVGTFSVGSFNEDKIGEGRQVRYILQEMGGEPTEAPPAWITSNPVGIRIGGQDSGSCNLAFTVGSPYLVLPPQLFENVVKKLRDAKKQALSESIAAIPDTLVSLINEYAATPKLRRFNCNEAEKIPDIQLGAWHIPSRMLYRRVGSECHLIVRFYDVNDEGNSHAFIGDGILRHFHVSVNFNDFDQQFLQISPRKDCSSDGNRQNRCSVS